MKMKYKIVVCLLFPCILKGQMSRQEQKVQPALVVGVVVDQMRYDYIYRFWNKYGENGFKRLVNKGFSCKNANYNYVPTFTGPGHASIYTGTTPATHGIIANAWYSRDKNKMVNCVDEFVEKGEGGGANSIMPGPANMLTTTIGDELRIFNLQKSKVIGVSLKDRSAILPAGHRANAAYWLSNDGSKFISSAHYMNELPKWVKDFNAKELPKKYLQKGWNTLLPLEQYSESLPDDSRFEDPHNKKDKPVFPYEYSTYLQRNNLDRGCEIGAIGQG